VASTDARALGIPSLTRGHARARGAAATTLCCYVLPPACLAQQLLHHGRPGAAPGAPPLADHGLPAFLADLAQSHACSVTCVLAFAPCSRPSIRPAVVVAVRSSSSPCQGQGAAPRPPRLPHAQLPKSAPPRRAAPPRQSRGPPLAEASPTPPAAWARPLARPAAPSETLHDVPSLQCSQYRLYR
jgi:hypothetical protein